MKYHKSKLHQQKTHRDNEVNSPNLRRLALSVALLFFAFNLHAQIPTIVCGSTCGNCDVPVSDSAPNPALSNTFYGQRYNLKNTSSFHSQTITLTAEKASLNNGTATASILSSINYVEQSPVTFQINPGSCKQVDVKFKISPTQGGTYRIFYGMYQGATRLQTLSGGDLWTEITIASCSPPTNLNANQTTNNSATISFTKGTGATQTKVFWKPTGPGTWLNTTTPGTQLPISGLSSNTSYVVNAQSVCGSVLSAYATNINFNTGTSTSSCAVPTGLNTTQPGSTYRRLNWGAVTGANRYELRYRPVGSSNWQYDTITPVTLFVSNLLSTTTYEWQVATKCPGTLSNWSASNTFTTLCQTPDAKLLVSQNQVLTNENFQLIDNSTNVPTSWLWEVEDGNTPTYSVQHPQNVSFSRPGYKKIILTDSNSCGWDKDSAFMEVYPNFGDQPFSLSDTRRPDYPKAMIGDPVNAYTGEFWLPINLFTILGMGNSYDFTITYNSLIDTKSIVGWNFDHNYNYQLVDSGDLWIVTNGTGAKQLFVPFGNEGVPYYKSEQDTMYIDNLNRYVLEKSNGTKIFFTAGTNLQKIEDRNENITSFTYNASNQTTRITFPGNRDLDIFYNSANLIRRIRNKANKSVYLFYNLNDELTSIVNLDGDTLHFNYGSNHKLTSTIDPKGNASVTNYYNAITGKVDSQSNAEGDMSYFSYNTPTTGVTRFTNEESEDTYYYHDTIGQVFQIKDAENNITKFGINGYGKIAHVINALNDTISKIEYDDKIDPVSITDANGYTTTIEYGAFHLPTKIKDAEGDSIVTQYDAKGNHIQTTYPNGSIRQDSVDVSGRLMWRITAGYKKSFGYNPTNWGGDLTTIYDEDGNDTYFDRVVNSGFIDEVTDRNSVDPEFTHSNSGLITETNYDDNTTDKYFHDKNRNLVTHINRSADTTIYDHFKTDWLKSITNAKGQTTFINRDKTGRVTKNIYPNGQIDSFTYYDNGWTKTKTDSFGTEYYYYFANGLMSQKIDALNRSTYYTYDNAGRPITITNAKNQTTRFIYNSKTLIAEVNSVGDTTYYEYDNMLNLTKVTDPMSFLSDLVYSPANILTSVTDAENHTTTFKHDSRGLLKTKQYATLDSMTTTYDDEELIKTFTDAEGITGTITRDNNNRVQNVTYTNGAFANFQYEPIGTMTQAQNSLGTEYMTYDDLGQLTREIGVFNDTMRYVFDPTTNNLSSIIYSGNKQVNYEYLKGLVSKVTDWNGNWATYEYSISQALEKITYSNGIVTDITRDGLDQIESKYIHKGSDTIAYYHLTRDSNNLIVQLEVKQPVMANYKTDTIGFSYDPANRPINGGWNIFDNDKNGNLKLFTNGVDSFSNAFGENNRVIYSAYNGDTTSQDYNARRSLARLTNGGNESRYTSTSIFGFPKFVEKRDGTNNIIQSYIHGADGMAWIMDTSGVRFVHTDYLGYIVALSDNAGNVTDSLATDLWGGNPIHLGNTDVPSGYLGGHGTTIHLGQSRYIVGVRNYNGKIARFTSTDDFPADYSSTQSREFSMANNSPANYVDPTGYLANIYKEIELFDVPPPNKSITFSATTSNGPIKSEFSPWRTFLKTLGEKVTDPEVLLDGLQNSFEVAGLVPGLGEPFDITNGFLYGLRGDKTNSALSFTSAVPGNYVSPSLKVANKVSKSVKAIKTGKYTITKTVSNNIATRPYINSPSTITNIINSGKGVADKFFKGGVNYKVPGNFNGSKGFFELGINHQTNTIYHFLFKSTK